jgi:hypothetical protein
VDTSAESSALGGSSLSAFSRLPLDVRSRCGLATEVPSLVVAVAAVVLAACHSSRASVAPVDDASGPVQLSLRVPAALMVERAMDTLSVGIDPATLGLTQVTADAATVLGVETQTRVFPEGRPREALDRRAIGAGTNFDMGATTWSTMKDGIPQPDTKYVVEMQIVLFETDVPVASHWDPHAGNFTPLWSRTLRQAEE